jgi:TPR repeat protein/transglutaminase-like putative cysteine protease
VKISQKVYGIIVLCLCWSQAVAANDNPSGKIGSQSFVRGAFAPAWIEKTPVLPDTGRLDPVVIRLADTQIQDGKELSIYYFRAIQVNDQEALNVIGQYAISYIPDYQKLFVHQVAILRKGQLRDQTATATMHLLQREQQLDAGMMGGQVTLQMLLNDVRIGDTLLVSYTISGKNPVFDGRWASTFAWDSSVPTEHRRLIVSHDRERPLFWAQRGDFKKTSIPFKAEPLGKNEKLIFEERGLDAVEEESGAPSEYLPGRVLEFSEYHDWHDIALWGDKLFPPQSLNTDLKMLVRKFAQEATSEKRAAAALRWVQNEIRYFSVSLGENSHKPRPSGLVFNTRFGDCKDKSYLLVALLAGLGIKAEPVLVSAQAPRYPSRALPSPLVFDHVIVRADVNGNSYFLDPTRTGQIEELDQLPVAVRNAAGLVIAPTTEKLIVLPDDPHDVPQFEIAERFMLPSLDGEGQLEARRTYRGNYAAAMRRFFSGTAAKTLGKYVLGLYEKTYPGLTLSGSPSVIEEGGNTVLITRYVIPHPLTLAEGRYELAIANKVLEGAIDLPDKIVRSYPFVPSAGQFRGRHIVQVTWPERSRVNNEVSAKTLDNHYFRYHREYFLRGNTLNYQMDFSSKVDRVDAVEMPQLQVETNRLEKTVVASFSVAADSIVNERALELRYRDIEGSLSAISFGRQVRSEANSANVHTVEDWCALLAQGYLGIGFMPEQERDNVLSFRLQEMAKSDRKEARRCLGGLAFMRQDFAQAVQYWSASAYEAGDALVPKLAWARLFQGDSVGALQDMGRYYEHQLATGVDNTMDLIQYVALLKRARSEVPDQLKARLTDQNSGVWPRPVATFLAGTMDADALLASAGALPRDAREFAMAEAWYYIGVSRLMSGDNGGARRAFRYLIANGAPSTMEYMLAKAEVDALWSKDPDYLAGADAEGQKKYSSAAALYEKAILRGDAQAAYALALFYYYGNGTPVDKARAFPLLRRAAEGDIAGAQNMMGIYYDEGEGGITKNMDEAAKWYSLSAGQYDLHGMRNFGNLLAQKSERNSPDFNRAVSYLQQSAGMGSHAAQADLGRKLRYQKPAFALFWTEFAAASGDKEDLLLLAEQLRTGETTLQDGERAKRILMPLAKEGNIEAQLSLGVMLEYGQGIEKNQTLALEWFQKAARQGSPVGKMRVARFYIYGDGVEKDFKKAAGLLREAVDGGVPYASYLLAGLYRRGQGLDADKKQAMMYYERAAAGGISDAEVAIADMFYFGKEGREQAVQWYRKAAQNGSSVAMNNLGDMYENGVGVPQDFAEAMNLYRQAAALSEGVAFRSLASMWSSGKAGKIDLRQAYLYYLLAAKIENKIAEEASALKQKLGADDLRALEAEAEKWKVGTPLPSA